MLQTAVNQVAFPSQPGAVRTSAAHDINPSTVTERGTMTTDHQAIDSTTIGEALTELQRYADPDAIEKAAKLADTFKDVIKPGTRIFHVAMAALMLGRDSMVMLKNSLDAEEAEIEARDARMAARAATRSRKAA